MNVLIRMVMVTLILGAALAAGTAHAGLLAYDGFDYTGTTLHGQNGGTGFSAAWNNAANDIFLASDGASLDSAATPFPVVGSRMTAPAGESRTAHRYVNDTFDFDDEGSQMYMSFLMRKNTTGAGSGETLDIRGYESYADHSGNITRVMIGSNDVFYVGLGAGYTTTGVTAVAGTTYFGVVKVVSHAGMAADEIYMNIYTSGGDVGTTEPTTWNASHTTTTISDMTLSRFKFDYNTNTNGDIDEFRYGDTWASVAVVPEPGTVSLMLALLCGAAVYLRKRA
jgi:hypothetical protein